MFGKFFTLLLAQASTINSLPTTAPSSTPQWMNIAIGVAVIFGVFVLPFLLGTAISKALRMSSYGFSIGVILATLFGAFSIIALGKLRYGPDIQGGTILVYELDKTALSSAGEDRPAVKSSALVTSLTNRINPTGTKEIIVRPYGEDQIEIIVPNVDQLEIAEIKRIVEQAGILKFRIVANPMDHGKIIEAARQQAASEDIKVRLNSDVKDADGNVVGIWQTIGRDPVSVQTIKPLRSPISSGDLIRDSRSGKIVNFPPNLENEHGHEKWLAQNEIADVDLLMALNGRDGKPFEIVTGDDLASVRQSVGNDGSPEVQFQMNATGAQRLLRLTGRNTPINGNFRRMAIILDGRVLSAPRLNSAITEQGVIQGNFTKKEVDFLVNILQSGSLPAALGKEPISESVTGAVLGAETIRKGFLASALSLVVTFVALLIYYRFAGVIACMALLMNMILIFSSIILIQQPITLPGLAGFVLSVGMSVDANVLVYERIREEVARKATGRMAIRNGFDNAMTTIIDSNLTTLISAIVLYAAGTDQIKGFAVPLIIGIVISMFTAVYCSRVFFEIAEKLRIASFSMMDGIGWIRRNFLGDKDVDFMALRNTCYALSLGAIAIGLIATGFRGKELLDIDFNGGTSVVFTLDKPLTADEVREETRKIFSEDEKGAPIQTTLTNISMEGQAANTVYRLDTSLLDVAEVTKRLSDGFAKADSKLVTYKVSVVSEPPKNSSSSLRNHQVRLVSLTTVQDANASPTNPAADANKSEPPVAELDKIPPQGSEANPTSGQPKPDVSAPVASAQASTEVTLKFTQGGDATSAKINGKSLVESIIGAAKKIGQSVNESQLDFYPEPMPEGWNNESMLGADVWKVKFPFPSETTNQIVIALQDQMNSQPVWLSVNKIGERVAGQMQVKAVASILISLVFIMIYIWFRFHKVAYGIAAVIALLHDVLLTLGLLAISHWLYKPLGFLMIEDFKISLTVVAAFLTIIGYSLNDTIVVFDRIREVKGKSPNLTGAMINKSVNETLSRTLLTSSTTLVAILLLFFLGGEGIHGFAFALFFGILTGTYSSIFVAAPILLWLVRFEEKREGLNKVSSMSPSRSA